MEKILELLRKKILRQVAALLLMPIFALVPVSPVFAAGSEESPLTIGNANLFTYNPSLDVDDASGAFTHRVDLEVPPGRIGVTPEVALTYNSQDLTDGIAGYGWSLSIPYIERMNETGSERLYTDNYFNSSLGGELATTSTGEYRHRTEDGRFIKYTFTNNTWVAYDKSGLRYSFGTSTAAQQSATSSTSRVFKWMLQEVRDSNSNFVRFEYTKDENQIYLSKILYSGNAGAGGIFTIDLSYASRTDSVTSYRTGFKVVTRNRLSQILASVNGSWVRKYALSYATGTNSTRSLLSGVQKTGRDSAGAELSVPATTFEYSTSTPAYEGNTNPQVFNGARVPADVDGNGLLDLSIFSGEEPSFGRTTQVNNYPAFTTANGSASASWSMGNSGWTEVYYPIERGARMFDVNGDGKADVIRGYNDSGGTVTRKYWENESSFDWVENGFSTTTIPMFGYSHNGTFYSSGLLGELNGDGLVDYVLSLPAINNNQAPNAAHLHAATSSAIWTATTTIFAAVASMEISPSTVNASALVDINGDGLDDWMRSGSGTTYFCLNTGTSWGTCGIGNSPWDIATSTRHANGWDRGIRFFDFNGDGLADYIRSYYMPSYTNKYPGYTDIEIGQYNYVYLNTGSGWATSTLTTPNFITKGELTGIWWGGRVEYNEHVDWNGDGIPDDRANTSKLPAGASNTKPDLLQRIKYGTGGKTDIEYKYTPQLLNNTQLPFPILVVTKITNSDNNGNVEVINRTYEGGKMYLAGNIRDRRFAGFNSVSKTDALGTTKTYYHQADTANTGAGEQTDGYHQIGKAYREDVISLASTTMRTAFTKWNSVDQGNGRAFVYRESDMVQHWDGDADHRDVATEYSYATTTGNLLQQVLRGEVVGNSDGTYADSGSDSIWKSYTYAASTTAQMSLPSQETIKNHASSTVKLTKFYYDDLVMGSTTKGNLTKQENWISGSTYASTTKAYNSHGLVTSERDPRYKLTSYTYETNNLYVATTTNPLSQTTGYTYDYATGKKKAVTDPNSRTQRSYYDPLGRLATSTAPDPSSGLEATQSVTNYFDSVFPNYTKSVKYLNSATSTDIYTYVDGFGRQIQERKEGTSEYFAKDNIYGNNGQLTNETLPYFSVGSSWTPPNTASSTLVTYAYDALKRITGITNYLGTETHAFDQWAETITDRNGNNKGLVSDAFGNLATILEYNPNAISTTYTFDALNNLTKITDALGNVRNFAYDGLSRATTTQDLHAPADTTFGTTSLTYDVSSNLTSKTDPKGQVINWTTYDDINRALSEDYTGATGTEISYSYDACINGKLRLCIATTSGAVTTFAYNALGLPSSEIKKINSISYTTSYLYDRQGNITDITYPDNSAVRYVHDSAGLLDKVFRKPANGSCTSILDNIDYAANGQISKKEFANGVQSTYTYDKYKLLRLTQIYTAKEGVGGAGEEISAFEETLPEFIPSFEIATTSSSLEEILGISTSTESEPASGTETSDELPTADVVFEETTETSTTTSEESAAPEPMESVSEENETTDTALAIALEDATSTVATSTELQLFVEASSTPADVLMDEFFASKPAKEKATAKGEEIAEFNRIRRTKRENYDIEVKSLEPIEDGVEVFVRAWNKKDKQVGFGVDGSVELERFRIVNPPVLVDDPKGDVVREWFDPVTHATTTRRLRYDPKEALLQILEHALSVMKNKHDDSRIVKGKMGKTTSVFYSNAGSGGTTFDGETAYDAASGTGDSWATVHNSSSCNLGWARTDFPSETLFYLENANPQTNWLTLGRTFFTFDTSALPDSDPISSAILSVYGNAKGDTLNISVDVSVYSAWPASNNNLVCDDYDEIEDTLLAAPLPYANFSTSGYNDLVFNATGTASIKKTGISKFATRNAQYDAANVEPSTSAGIRMHAYVQGYMADQTGTTNDPKLVVEHGTIASSSPDSEGLQNLNYEYDAVGNITQLDDTSSTDTNKTSTFIYDALYRLIVASTTQASTTPYYFEYAYNEIGNILSFGTSVATTTLPGDGPSIVATSTTRAPGNTSSDSFSFDSGSTGNNRLLIYMFASPSGGAPTTASYGGQALTTRTFTINQYHVGWGYLADPPTGSNTFSINYPSQIRPSYKVYVLQDVNDIPTPYDVDGNSNGGGVTSCSKTLTTTVDNDLLLAWVMKTGSAENVVQGSGQTEEWDERPYGVNETWAGGTKETTTAGDQTMSFSWGTAGSCEELMVALRAASSGETATTTPYKYEGTGYANPHAVTTIGGSATTTYTYDKNGNLTNATSTATTTVYQWDYRNRMATSTIQGAATTTYWFDHLNENVRKMVGGTATTTYPSKYYEILAPKSTGQGTTTSYVYLPDGTLVAEVKGNGVSTSTYYVHQDHLGNVSVLTNASGTATSVSDFYPYGAERVSSGTDVTDKGYIGERYDSSNGLQYLHARFMQPSRGQFVSQDATHLAVNQPGAVQQLTGQSFKQYLSDPQQLNSYSYAKNNPIVNKDPTGNNPYAYGGAFVAGAIYGTVKQFEYDRAAGTVSSVPQYMKAQFSGGLQGVAALGAIELLGPAGALRAYGTYETGANIYDFTKKTLINESSYNPQQKMQSLDILYRDLATRVISYGILKEYRIIYESLRSTYDSLEKIYNQSNANSTAQQSSASGGSQRGVPSGKDSKGKQIYCYGACGK